MPYILVEFIWAYADDYSDLMDISLSFERLKA